MKVFIFLLNLVLLIFACTEKKENDYREVIGNLKKINLDVFENLVITGRGEKNGIIRAFKYNVYANDSCYLIPNFDYYPFDSLKPSIQKELLDYAMTNGQSAEKAVNFIEKKSKSVYHEFAKSKMYSITADQKTCGCIIFFPDGGGRYLMYFPKEIEIKAEVWKEYFAKARMVEEHWYVGEIKKTECFSEKLKISCNY